MMATATPLQRQIESSALGYLGGGATLEEFRELFLRESWDVDATEDFGSQWLAHRIEHLFAELSHGALTEPEFKAQIGALTLRSETFSANRSADVAYVFTRPLQVA
jgi:hypothetical protein